MSLSLYQSARRPGVYAHCRDCGWDPWKEFPGAGEPPADFRAEAVAHVEETGHTVSLAVVQTWYLVPEGETPEFRVLNRPEGSPTWGEVDARL